MRAYFANLLVSTVLGAAVLLVPGHAVLADAPGPAPLPRPSLGFVSDMSDAGQAVARVLKGGQEHCRAVVLDAEHVLTAAHCVRDPGGERFARDLLIQATGDRLASVVDAAFVPGFRYASYQDAPWAVLDRDVAVLRLADPLSVPAMNLFRLEGGAETVWLMRVDGTGWEACPVRGDEGRRPVFWIGCERQSGQSGSPVVLFSDGRADVVGVVVARAPSGGLFAHHVGPILHQMLWTTSLETPSR